MSFSWGGNGRWKRGDAVRDLPVVDLKRAAGLRGWLLCARMRVCAPSMRAFFRRIGTSDSAGGARPTRRRRIEVREVVSRPSRIFMGRLVGVFLYVCLFCFFFGATESRRMGLTHTGKKANCLFKRGIWMMEVRV